MPVFAAKRVVLHERAQVVCGGLPDFLPQADHEQLGELEDPWLSPRQVVVTRVPSATGSITASVSR